MVFNIEGRASGQKPTLMRTLLTSNKFSYADFMCSTRFRSIPRFMDIYQRVPI